ncbi:hypothetical protein [Sanyastnella coralliicola]|uniref:hypothetical protein n=1 Tax=Sanyastnella coralliicola TaxID=3069118 RepID=UPI0027B95E2A|nr:hypothetical protein [Longitalea sp. SCSIO 12813]
MKKILSFFAAVLLLASCVVENDIYFDKDFSGYSETKLDLSTLFTAMAELEGDTVYTTQADKDQAVRKFMIEFMEDSDELFTEIEKEVGKDNFTFTVDTLNLKLNMKITFDDLESLNTIMANSYDPEEGNMPESFVSKDGKTLRMWVRQGEAGEKELLREINTLHFKHKIKSCNLDVAKVSDHTITYDTGDVKEGMMMEIVLK